MGFPINPDGTIDYDNPAPSPTYQHYAVKGRARDDDGQPININRVTYALKDEAECRALIEQEYDLYGDATHTLTWMDEPVVALAYTSAPSPTRLTDGAAGYGEPSAAAMKAAKRVLGASIEARDIVTVIAAHLDAFATQQAAAAVEAERERVVEVFAKAASDTNRGLYEPDKRPPAPHDAIILALHLAYKRLGVRGLKKDETATHF